MQPRASRDEVVGWHADALRVRVTAPPVGGDANRAVVAVMARALGVRPSAVSIVAGERGRDKLVRIDGLSATEIRSRIQG